MNCKGDCKDIEKTVTLDLFCKTKCVHCRSVTKRSRNIVLSVNNLRFRLLHIFQNQNTEDIRREVDEANACILLKREYHDGLCF